MKILPASLLLLLLALLLPPGSAHAVDGSIEEIEPSNARQGQTVMLTISGSNLPQGAVSLDFFPQRIQLVKILSATDQEIVAQIRIPQTAPAGAYNILVYNHLGEEAFGEKMFTVDSDLVVPVINDYDPKVIAEADNGFALILNCDTISEAAISHLNIEWSKGSLQLRRLETVFTYAGPDKILAAVSGALPEGSIRGRLRFDNTPIYLVDLTIRSSGAYVLGFSPSELEPGAGRELKLVGSGFTSSFLDGLDIQLLNGDTPILPQAKRVQDSNSISLSFDADLQPGTYTLVVRQGEETLLLEDVKVRQGGILSQDTLNGISNPQSQDTQPDIPTDPMDPLADWQPFSNDTQPTDDLLSLEIAKMEMQAGADPARFTLSGDHLTDIDADNLKFSLERTSGSSELLFSGLTNNGITCIFGPQGGDWLAGEQLTLHIDDDDNRLRPFALALELTTDGIRQAERDFSPAIAGSNSIPGSNWSVVLTSHERKDDLYEAVFHLRNDGNEAVAAETINAEFSFTPDDSRYLQAFSNISSQGVATVTGENGSYQARLTGLFVPGDLRLKLSIDGVAVLDSIQQFDFGLPAANVDLSGIEGLVFNTASQTMDRSELQCSIDFAPFIPLTTDWLASRLIPSPVLVHSDTVKQIAGSTVNLRVPTGNWDPQVEFGVGIQLQLESSIELDWSNGKSVIFPVSTSQTATDEISVSVPKRPVIVNEQGFTLTILPSGNGAMDLDWTRVKLSSDNMLLNNNIDSFAVSMETVDFVGQPAVNLLFSRGRGLSEDAYEVLAGQLVDAGEIAITLYWDEILYSWQGSIDMVR